MGFLLCMVLMVTTETEVPLDLLVLIEQTRTPVEPEPDGAGREKAAAVSVPPTTVAPARPATRIRYPVRGGWWSGCPSWQHMLTGPHRGKYDPVWLSQLTNAELQSLHSDDHEGRVRQQYTVSPRAYREGGYYERRCDGRSCRWVWVPTQSRLQPRSSQRPRLNFFANRKMR